MKPWIFDSKLEEYPNPEWLGIHTRAPLTVDPCAYYGSIDREPKKKGFTILTAALIKALKQIPGVIEVSCRKHRVSIQRSMSYSWDEILERATPIFVSYCPANY